MSGFYAQVVQMTNSLVSTKQPVFESWGMGMFATFSACLLVWEGALMAFGDRAGNRIPALLMQIAITYAALACYSTPFPGAGKSLTHMVTDFGADVADQIDTTQQEAAGKDMADTIGNLSMTSWSMFSAPAETTRYFIIFMALAAMQFLMLGIIAFGFVALGVLVMIGPLLLPFNLVPGFDWLAWGWMRSLVQYAFYPVVGNAFIAVFGGIWANFWNQFSGPVDVSTIGASITQIVILTLAGIYGMLKVPQLVAGIFSGSSGISAFPGFGWWR